MELATLVSHRGQAVVAHTFNPSTREVETGVIWLGRERTITQKETGAQDSV